MKKTILFAFLFVTAVSVVHAQKTFFTKSGRITFFSSAPLEDIEASTKTAAAVLDASSGNLQFSVLMKSFDFKKALMQEHFNSDYVESNTFPTSEFKGAITNNKAINYSKPGVYTADVKGKLTLHGITKDVATRGTLTVTANNLQAVSTFTVLLSDYGIKRPALARNKISNTIKITIDCTLDPLAK